MLPLHVISVISNPIRFRSRYQLYREFSQRIDRSPGVAHYTAELAFGDRPFEVTNSANLKHFQFRTWDELWHKESIINLALSRLPADWQYVAWIDADVEFVDPNWALETVQQLQHYMVVQMFQTAVDLGPTKETMEIHQGFGYSHVTGKPRALNAYYPYPFWHPGFAWAARREALEGTGWLLDSAILGAGDHHMALALIGEGAQSVPGNIHPNYRQEVMTWQERAERTIKRDIGFVPGTLLHHFHGKKKDRQYQSRWDIITNNNFDPRTDIYRDPQGLWVLNPDRLQLRDDIRRYFRTRNEDSIDLE